MLINSALEKACGETAVELVAELYGQLKQYIYTRITSISEHCRNPPLKVIALVCIIHVFAPVAIGDTQTN
jgi:hypothetical protein